MEFCDLHREEQRESGVWDPGGALPSYLIFVSFSFLLHAVSSEVGSKDELVQETGQRHPPGVPRAGGP